MDTSKILRPEQLPFFVPEQLADDINALIEALAREDKMLDCYLDEVQGSARMLNEEQDTWIRQYYVQFGWRKQTETQKQNSGVTNMAEQAQEAFGSTPVLVKNNLSSNIER